MGELKPRWVKWFVQGLWLLGNSGAGFGESRSNSRAGILATSQSSASELSAEEQFCPWVKPAQGLGMNVLHLCWGARQTAHSRLLETAHCWYLQVGGCSCAKIRWLNNLGSDRYKLIMPRRKWILTGLGTFKAAECLNLKALLKSHVLPGVFSLKDEQ